MNCKHARIKIELVHFHLPVLSMQGEVLHSYDHTGDIIMSDTIITVTHVHMY